MNHPLLEIEYLNKEYQLSSAGWRHRRKTLKALEGINLTLSEGNSVGVVGESGCGKSTLAKLIMGLEIPTTGTIKFRGKPIDQWLKEDPATYRQSVQMIFQDPISSLNPRLNIETIMNLQLKRLTDLNKEKRNERIKQLLEQVQLSPTVLKRYPHEFSGGQAQRISIARALLSQPKLLLLDEPVSALDVSVQAQILQLLNTMRRDLNLTYLFISHDLAVVEQICPRLTVMFAGRIVEQGETVSIFQNRSHPYTDLLLKSVPRLKQPLKIGDKTIEGDLPESGCNFRNRCQWASSECFQAPTLISSTSRPDHLCACHHPLE